MSGRMGGAFGTRSRRSAPALRRDARPQDLRNRLSAYAALMLFVLLVLLGRLWVLQVVRGEEYAREAQSNHLKEREIPAPRGSIYDAEGQRLAEVRASFDLVIQPRDVDATPVGDRQPRRRSSVPGADGGGGAEDDGAAGLLGGPLLDDLWTIEERTDILTLSERLAPLLDDSTVDEVLERWDEARKTSRHRQLVLAPDVSFEELERVLANRPRLPGISVASRHRRSYSDPELFAHLLGYQREVRTDDLKRLRSKYKDTDHGEDWYESGDLIGKFGIEAGWEEWLRGTDGAYWVQVDALGRQLGRSADPNQPGAEYFRSIAHFLDTEVIPEVPGHDLHLTVRSDLQRLGYDLLGEQSGSVVMLEVNTGRVLSLVNAPSFDPAIFARRLPPHTWNALQNDPQRPMVDKSLTGIYPPGSTWKMLVAAAVLGSETWTKDTSVVCKGGHRIGRRTWHCWKRSGHGKVDLDGALKGSCDTYFYRAGLAMGIDEVAHYASMFGMGKPTGIGINSESGALNPTTAWKKRRYGSGSRGVWTPGDTASAVIGQGATLATPIQLAVMTAALANGGLVYRPLIVDRVVAADGRVVHREDPQVKSQVDLAPEHFDAIREGMFSVVNEVGGTARRQRLPELAFAGKTGTAQVVALGASNAKEHRDHAWFVAFAPYEDPEVAITVLVENGEHGSTAAAPIARKMFELYFKERMAEAKEAGLRIGAPAEDE
ncbi:MAG: penicillin-binding protein 2 [Deltaproteobacteria bacterium]|nr:penicillin-binding protein 2 [Deltaproteobacteria bacterium]